MATGYYQKKNKRYGLQIFLLIILLLAALLAGAIFYYGRTVTPDATWKQTTASFFHTVSRQFGNLLPGVGKDPVDLSPYQAEDFYQENGFIHCSASPVSRVGIDVSAHQGSIDWQAVADAGVDFAIIRAGYRGYTTGALEEDPMYDANMEGALAAGLDVGVYFYSQAISTAEAREEAQFVLDRLGGYEITYPIIFDWEQGEAEERTDHVDNETLTDCAIAFCDSIEAQGYRAGCYFNQSFGYDRFDLRQLDDYCFWLAEYDDYQSFLYDVELWQYTNSGTVAGIDTIVDLNLCFVDFHAPAESSEEDAA